MTLALQFTQLLTAFSSLDSLQSLLLCHQPDRIRDERVPGPADGDCPRLVIEQIHSLWVPANWVGQWTLTSCHDQISAAGGNKDPGLATGWMRICPITKEAHAVHLLCMFHCRPSRQRGEKDYGIGPVFTYRSAAFWFFMCLSVWLAMCTHTDVFVCLLGVHRQPWCCLDLARQRCKKLHFCWAIRSINTNQHFYCRQEVISAKGHG